MPICDTLVFEISSIIYFISSGLITFYTSIYTLFKFGTYEKILGE